VVVGLPVILNKRSLRGEGSGEPRDVSRSCDAKIARLARFLIKPTQYVKMI
jgi:hypothetical protein